MDPNEALNRIRQAVSKALPEEGMAPVNIVEVAWFVEHFRALDEWLSNGGFLPDDWDYSDDPDK